MAAPDAEAVAIAGLARIASDDHLMGRFSSLTGIAANDMREAAAQAGFLVGVLDFYLAHEPDLLAWCESEGWAPDTIIKARIALAPNDTAGLE